jgi:hypothetical protein
MRQHDAVRAGGSLAIGDARRSQEGISNGGWQIERGRERPNGFWVRTAALPTFQRAHGMYGKASDRRKFFLRKTGGFAQRLQSRPEGARSASAHRSILCEERGVRVSYERCTWRPMPTCFTLECIAARNVSDASGRKTAAVMRQVFSA